MPPFAAAVLPLLDELGEELSRKAPQEPGTRDRFIAKAALLLGISTGLAAHAGINLSRILLLDKHELLDWESMARLAVVAGGAVTAVLVILCIVMLGRTSRTHLVLIELLTIGLAGAIGSSFVELRDYNERFDRAPPSIEAAVIDDKYSSSCGKRGNRTCYYIETSPSPSYPHGHYRQVDVGLYESLEKGSRVTMTSHPGALGFRWIELPVPASGGAAVP